MLKVMVMKLEFEISFHMKSIHKNNINFFIVQSKCM